MGALVVRNVGSDVVCGSHAGPVDLDDHTDLETHLCSPLVVSEHDVDTAERGNYAPEDLLDWSTEVKRRLFLWYPEENVLLVSPPWDLTRGKTDTRARSKSPWKSTSDVYCSCPNAYSKLGVEDEIPWSTVAFYVLCSSPTFDRSHHHCSTCNGLSLCCRNAFIHLKRA